MWLLIQAAPAAMAVTELGGFMPLHIHVSAFNGHAAAVRLLLAARAPGVNAPVHGSLPLHFAALAGSAGAVQALLSAWPAAAQQTNAVGYLPLHCALLHLRSLHAACILLRALGLSPGQLLVVIACRRHQDWHPHFVVLAALYSLSAAEWQRMPSPCLGLGRALPAVLARSESEVRHLMAHLSHQDRARLCTFALCLARWQRVMGLPLPVPALRCMLSLSDARVTLYSPRRQHPFAPH